MLGIYAGLVTSLVLALVFWRSDRRGNRRRTR